MSKRRRKLLATSGHKLKSGTRTITESICATKRCKFFGKPAQQGVCYSRLDTGDDRYIKRVLGEGEGFLKEMKGLRKRNGAGTDAKWIKYLESHIVCQWANTHFSLDELIHLRAECAKLRIRNKELESKVR